MSVTVDEILNAARAGVASLTGETAGYLVLGAADRLSEASGRLESSAVLLGEDGTVAAGRLGAGSTAELEADLRALLARMLSHARQGVPALIRVSRPAEGRGVARLVGEIEAALIPVNRAAARRALSRLHRDVGRAKATGKLGVAEPSPHESPAAAIRVAPVVRVAQAEPMVQGEVDPPLNAPVAVAPAAQSVPELVVPELVVPPPLARCSNTWPAEASLASVPAPPQPEPPTGLSERADSFTAPLPPAELVAPYERARVEPFASVPHRHPSAPEAILADSHVVEAPPKRVFGAPPVVPVPEEPERTPLGEEVDAEAFGAPPVEIVVSEADIFDAQVYEPEATPFLGSWAAVASVVLPERTLEWPSAGDHDTDRLPPVRFEASDEPDIGAALQAIDAAFAAESAPEAVELGVAVELALAVECLPAVAAVASPAIEAVAVAASVHFAAVVETAPETIEAASAIEVPAKSFEVEAIEVVEVAEVVEAIEIGSVVEAAPVVEEGAAVEVVPEAVDVAVEVIDAAEPEAIELGAAVGLVLAAECAPQLADVSPPEIEAVAAVEIAPEATEIVSAVEVPVAVDIASEPLAVAPAVEIVAQAMEVVGVAAVPEIALEAIAVAPTIEVAPEVLEAAIELIDAVFAAQSAPESDELGVAVDLALAVECVPAVEVAAEVIAVAPEVEAAPPALEVLPAAELTAADEVVPDVIAAAAIFEFWPDETAFELDAEPLDPFAETASPLPPVAPRDEPARPLECSALPLDLAFAAVPPCEAPTESPPPCSYKPRRSDVSELLAGFGVAESRSLRDISSELKRMADATGTPCPPAVVGRLPKKTAAR
jgi:hypothetical protein